MLLSYNLFSTESSRSFLFWLLIITQLVLLVPHPHFVTSSLKLVYLNCKTICVVGFPMSFTHLYCPSQIERQLIWEQNLIFVPTKKLTFIWLHQNMIKYTYSIHTYTYTYTYSIHTTSKLLLIPTTRLTFIWLSALASTHDKIYTINKLPIIP